MIWGLLLYLIIRPAMKDTPKKQDFPDRIKNHARAR